MQTSKTLESRQRSQWTDTAWSRDEEGALVIHLLAGKRAAGRETNVRRHGIRYQGLANCGGGVDGLTGIQTTQDNKGLGCALEQMQSAAPCRARSTAVTDHSAGRYPNPARRWCYIFAPQMQAIASRCCRAYAPNEVLFGHWNLGFYP